MYLHKEGKVAEYLMSDGVWFLKNKRFEYLFFPKRADEEELFAAKEEAYNVAMDYHETEGCALYLELYPAPEKGEYGFIAQDADGEWCGYDHKPDLKEDSWVERTSLDWHHICKSPPNPFWRKTLR